MTSSPFFNHSLATKAEYVDSVSSGGDDGGFAEFKTGISGILGNLPGKVIRQLYRDYQNAEEPLLAATNAYFDKPEMYQLDTLGGLKRVAHFDMPEQKQLKQLKEEPVVSQREAPREYDDDLSVEHYLGTLELECWCTRTTMGASRFSNSIIHLQPLNDAVYVKCDDGGRERELGRLNEYSAAMFVPLLDDGSSIGFRPTGLMMVGSTLHIGDTFTVQVDVFLKPEAFSADQNEKDFMRAFRMSTSSGALGNNADDSKEKAMYRRRTSLMKVFGALGMDQPEIGSGSDSDSASRSASPANEGEVTMNQLRDLYQSAQFSAMETDLPETAPKKFGLDLRPYQKYGLSWMLQREHEYSLIDGYEEDNNEKETVNPLWTEFKWPKVPERLGGGDDRGSFYVNLCDGSCSTKLPTMKTDCLGGILADEMGLGKTITALSLVFTAPRDLEPSENRRYASKTTLIVVPMGLLSQWRQEFERVNTSRKNLCYIYYGNDTVDDLKGMLCDDPNPHMVILTTYGTIQSEWSAFSTNADACSGLFSVKFHRVICDEGHTIRNRSTKTAKALFTLKASRRWLLTGTPIINRLEDLYSLIRFLQFNPWSNHQLWKHFVAAPFETGKDVPLAFNLLKSILDPILLRRTKDQRGKDGKLLVELPPKEISIERLKFNEKEHAVYEWLKARAVNTFKENMRQGMVLKNYSSILTHLLRLRQVSCHLDLVKQQDAGDMEKELGGDVVRELMSPADEDTLEVVREFEEKETEEKMTPEDVSAWQEDIHQLYTTFDNIECSICTGPIDIKRCVITECKHCFCTECLAEHFDFQEQHSEDGKVLCPMCRAELNRNRLFEVAMDSTAGGDNDGTQYTTRPYDPYGKSSKVNALLAHLHQIHDESPDEHVIVFSQFTSFLDTIDRELKKFGDEFTVFQFDGRLNVDQRQKVLSGFEKSNKPGSISVLLLSLKAGGVGLNLTVASRAFMMDPHWNTAVEFQAMDRLHRVGQKKSVKVIRFIMEGSIEERMLEIQRKKNQLGEALTISDEERRKQKIEEIESLFKE